MIQDATETHATHIAFEKLKGIRKRMSNLPKYQQWIFNQIQEYVEYKATECDISMAFVKPENTSNNCSFVECKHSGDANCCGREFECEECGRSWDADYNETWEYWVALVAVECSTDEPFVWEGYESASFDVSLLREQIPKTGCPLESQRV
jgi:IS605 OrfB family transposase